MFFRFIGSVDLEPLCLAREAFFCLSGVTADGIAPKHATSQVDGAATEAFEVVRSGHALTLIFHIWALESSFLSCLDIFGKCAAQVLNAMKNATYILIACVGVGFSVAHAADLSLLDDFGRPDIQEQYLHLGNPINSSIAGVYQEGSLNSARIDQSGGLSNVAEVWQLGSQSKAIINQVGSGNQVHLLQSGDLMEANLIQNGTGNQMAIQMTGPSSMVTGEQVGNNNRVVSVLSDNSSLTFTQTGDGHLLQIDVGFGMNVTVVQP